MTMHSAKWRLAGIWFTGTGVMCVVLVGQSLCGYYEPRTEDAWGWFLPTVMPTLSLIVGALVADYRSRQPAKQDRSNLAEGRLFRLGAGLSLFYLLLVALSILIQPFLPQTPPLERRQAALEHRDRHWRGHATHRCDVRRTVRRWSDASGNVRRGRGEPNGRRAGATYLPARCASRIDPIVALRADM